MTYCMTNWWATLVAGSTTPTKTGPGGGPVPEELARNIGSVLVVIGMVMVILIGLGAVALVMMMGGRLRRQVQDERPDRGQEPDRMWSLQVSPEDDEHPDRS